MFFHIRVWCTRVHHRIFEGCLQNKYGSWRHVRVPAQHRKLPNVDVHGSQLYEGVVGLQEACPLPLRLKWLLLLFIGWSDDRRHPCEFILLLLMFM
jgi:hypothetical protein